MASLRSYNGCCNENVKLSDLRLVHVGRVVQNMRSTLSLVSHANGYHVKATVNEIFTSRACVVVRTSNGKISRRGLADYIRRKIAPKSVLRVLHDYFSSFNQSNNWFVALLLCPTEKPFNAKK